MRGPVRKYLFFFLAGAFWNVTALAQSTVEKVPSSKLLSSIEHRIHDSKTRLESQSNKYLAKLRRKEERLYRKAYRKDSVNAKLVFGDIDAFYTGLASKEPDSTHVAYNGHLDSLKSALFYIGDGNPKATALRNRVQELQASTYKEELIGKELAKRQAQLKAGLQDLGLVQQLKGYQKEVYYYRAQVAEITEGFKDPGKLAKKALNRLAEEPAFQKFFRENSDLSRLFALPGGGSPDPAVALAGLQTRSSVNSLIQQRFGNAPGTMQQLRQNITTAQGQLQQLKNKALSLGEGSYGNGSPEMPEGFKPNGQKTKTFLQRLEYGFNLQTHKSTNYFPAMTDLGATLGYKLHDKSSAGVGLSYKLGLGRGWDAIRLSGEGVGLRSWADFRIKKSLYLAGGYELNYRARFDNPALLPSLQRWQPSGLVGLSKKYKVSKKLKGNMQLMWDFLSYRQIPRT